MKSQNKTHKPTQTGHSRLSEIGKILANGINRLLIKESQKNRESSLDSVGLESVHGMHNNFK